MENHHAVDPSWSVVAAYKNCILQQLTDGCRIHSRTVQSLNVRVHDNARIFLAIELRARLSVARLYFIIVCCLADPANQQQYNNNNNGIAALLIVERNLTPGSCLTSETKK
jgi:hypothetical protein